MSELFAASAAGKLREFFCVGTAAVVIPAARIGWQRQRQRRQQQQPSTSSAADDDDSDSDDVQLEDILLPVVGGGGGQGGQQVQGCWSLAQALWERLVDIQEGRVEWEGWSVPCNVSDDDA